MKVKLAGGRKPMLEHAEENATAPGFQSANGEWWRRRSV
jgi:hypothetical protein